MARPIVLSNGELHVGLNSFATVHDFYFPYVGLENHCAGANLRHKIGVWTEGQISWIDNPKNKDDEWEFTFRYPHDALIGHSIAKNKRLGIILEFDDFVDSGSNSFIRNIHVVNLVDRSREIRLFMHQAFVIADSRSNTDTVQYLPDNHAILHYRGRRAFIVSGECHGEPFDQHTVGLFGIEGKEGTYRDAEDGELQCNNVEHGRVDSTIRFKFDIDAHSSQRVHYWIAAGTSIRSALSAHKKLKDNGLLVHMEETAKWWQEWLSPAYNIIDKIPQEYRPTFIKSLLVVKSQIDNHGAVIASTDTSMLNYSRDAYAYSWPRDGAYAIWPLVRMGYTEEVYRFFEFTKRGMHPDGCMMHKYRADGAVGSSWHPYVHEEGIVAPPIQEDETALPLYVFIQFYRLNPSKAILKQFYKSMVVPMADFLASYTDHGTGLPKPSYDLWEQTFLTSTYTTAVVFAALSAASDLADEINDPDNAVKWRTSANDIQEAAHRYLYNEDKKVFRRGAFIGRDSKVSYDDTVDCSSVFGAYMYGLFTPDSEEVKNSIETLKNLFGLNRGKLGLPRYENDNYRRAHHEIAGNHWYITSFWLAQYYIDNNEPKKARDILDWAKGHAMSTGIMGEQIDPVTDEIVSPAPLTWSHAEYLATILDLISLDKK